jgi:hypothetical protein
MSQRMLPPTTVVDWIPSVGIQCAVNRGAFCYSDSAHVHIIHPQPEPWLSN